MRTIFLDTVGLIALWESKDQWHVQAETTMRSLAKTPLRVVTTTLVLFECGNAAARKPYRSDVFQLHQKLQVRGDLIQPTDAEVDQAWLAY